MVFDRQGNRGEHQTPAEAVRLWNERHLVGTLVRLRHDNGDAPLVRTRSEAFLSESGEAVCFFEGISGYYLLDRATPVADHEHGLV